MSMGLFGRSFNLLMGRIQPPITDVFADGVVKEKGVLADDADVIP